MPKFIVRTTGGFSFSHAVDIADYIREIYPDVTVGALLAFARQRETERDSAFKAARRNLRKRLGRAPSSRNESYNSPEMRAYSRAYNIRNNVRAENLERARDAERLAHEFIGGWGRMKMGETAARAIALLKQDEILLEVLDMNPSPDER